MIDLHMINAALAGLGIGAAAVVLIAGAVLAVVAFARRGHAGQPIVPASAGVFRDAADSARDEVRETALR
jgi:hypothetical protein